MAKCQRNDIGSVALHRVSAGGHYRQWSSSFSTAAFRRKFCYAVSCGGSSRYRHHHGFCVDDGTIASAIRSVSEIKDEKLVDKRKPDAKSERLLDLLRLESSESETDTKKKEEVLEELKCEVKNLQHEDLEKKRAGAYQLSLFAKEDAAVSQTLSMSMLGAHTSRYHHNHHDGVVDDGTIASAIWSVTEIENEKLIDKRKLSNAKSEKLLYLLKLESSEMSESETDTKKKEEVLEELKCAVKNLQHEDLEKRTAAASQVRSFAKADAEARRTLAMLGAIPPLIEMLDSEDDESKIASLYALLNLAVGNDTNKAAIVKAGAVHKMLVLVKSDTSTNPSISEAIVANFLGLSASDANKLVVGSSGAIPFLVKKLYALDNKKSSQAKQDALRALFNLSLFPSNVKFILETDLIPFLFNKLGDNEVSERALSIISNVVSTPEGRKTISTTPDALSILIDVLSWTDSPGCQEKASYILMVIAHKSYSDRQAMIEAGVSSVLLELTLLGSTLAQKRASRMLEYLSDGKGKRARDLSGRNLSAPICGSSTIPNVDFNECLVESEDLMSEEKRAVKQLVKQSLQNNMWRIVNRANLPQDFVPSDHFKSLTSSSTSKSLPF